MSILSALNEYLKINQLAFWAIVLLAVLSGLKYVKIISSVKWPKPLMLLSVIVLGLVLRIGWIQFSSYEPLMDRSVGNYIENDLINFHAIELTQGKWFVNDAGEPTGRRPIGYPMLLGFCYKIFGVHRAVGWGLQLLLYVLTAVLLYQMAKLCAGERIALWVVLFFSVYPVSVYSIKLLTDEYLFMPLWYFGIYLLMREAGGAHRRWSWLWYGLIFGYATMTRTHTLFMPLVIALVYWVKKWSWRLIVTTSFLTLFVMQLINLPWVVRNYRAWGVPVMYTATSCFMFSQFHTGVKPEGGGKMPVKGDPDYSEAIATAANEGIGHQLCSRAMKDWAVRHPAAAVELGISRLLVFMNWNRWGGVWPLFFQYDQAANAKPFQGPLREFLEEIAYEAYYFLFYTFLIGAGMVWLNRKKMSSEARAAFFIIGLCFMFWFAEHMIIYPDRKYRYPLEPFMMIFSCCFIDYLVCAFRWETLFVTVKNLLRKQAKAPA